MKFGLLIIGDEILSGKREDKHLPKVIELLGARGLSLSWARYAGDERDRITADLRDAFASRRRGVFLRRHRCDAGRSHAPMRRRGARPRARLHPRAKELILERMRDIAAERGEPYEPDRADNVHRLNMGVFPEGAELIANPYNKIPGFSVGTVYFVPGFPVMAWPMIESVLDTHFAHLHRRDSFVERSVIVFGTMEATLTPLMEAIETRHAGVRVFSLPSVDHPQWGRHIELGVKGAPAQVGPAYQDLLAGLLEHDAKLGPEVVR